MNSWHSVGDVAVLGNIAVILGNSRARRSMLSCALANRGSPANVAASGGGHGHMDSHVLIERTAGSSPSKQASALDPVRGSPKPINGATISPSSISGCRRYQSSIRSRSESMETICVSIDMRPRSLRRASLSKEATRISKPSRNESGPKSPRPVAARACASNWATLLICNP